MNNNYKFYISSGKGQSLYQLTAFDESLREVGIGDYNLLKISSILPSQAQKMDDINVTKGLLLPTAYSNICSNIPCDKIASAVGVAIPQDSKEVGVIMEFASHCSKQEAEETIKAMLIEAMSKRNRPYKELIISANEAIIPEDNKGEYTSLVSAIALWATP